MVKPKAGKNDAGGIGKRGWRNPRGDFGITFILRAFKNKKFYKDERNN